MPLDHFSLRKKSDNAVSSPIRAFVHLAYGFGAKNWSHRWREGRILGVNEEYAYGYMHASSDELSVIYSEDKDESKVDKFFRLAVRGLLGFDFIHALRNRSEIFRSDVLWTHTESQYLSVSLLLLLSRRTRKPKIIGQSVWIFDRWARWSAIRRFIYSSLIRRVDVLTVHSSKNLIVARKLFPEKQAKVVYFGIKGDWLSPVRRQPISNIPTIISLGNDEHRDWRALISAADLLGNCQILIASNKLDRSLLRKTPNISLVKIQNNEQLEDLYRSADIVVVPLKENLHASGLTVLLEAAVFGVPVVCTDTGGLRDYFGPSEVCYVPPGCYDDIATAVKALLADDERRWSLAENAQRKMGEAGFTSRNYARQHAELSKQLVSR